MKPRDLWQKVVRTVCSLANRHGGYLLLGVSDEGNVVGIDQAVASMSSDTDETGRNVFKGSLRKQLQDHLTNKPVMDIRWTQIDGRLILLIKVQRNAPGMPCAVGDQIYVRRGSTTRPALLDEQRDLLCSSLQTSG